MILWCLDVPTGCSTEWYKLGVAALTFKDHHIRAYCCARGARGSFVVLRWGTLSATSLKKICLTRPYRLLGAHNLLRDTLRDPRSPLISVLTTLVADAQSLLHPVRVRVAVDTPIQHTLTTRSSGRESTSALCLALSVRYALLLLRSTEQSDSPPSCVLVLHLVTTSTMRYL